MRRIRFATIFALSLAVLAPAAHSAQRTFVSTSGLDTNGCTLVAPCRGFAKAITVTDPGGELVVLDSGGYGVVTVDKNVTILSPAGVYAGISVFAASDGITVAAPATKVVLRGLTINGQGGNNGINVQAGEVHVEGCVIANLGQAGILISGGSAVRISGTVVRSNVDGLKVLPGAGSVAVLVRESEFAGHSGSGIVVSPVGAGNSAQVTLERASVTKNGVGISSSPGGGGTALVVIAQSVTSENVGAGVASGGSGATVWVRESAVTRNGVGLFQGGSSVLNACGANLLVANGSATIGTINTASCLDVAATGGSVTSLSQGSGITLTPNPITATGTIAADAAYLQRRVTGTCGIGSSIRTINSDGTVGCEVDDVGTGTVTSVATGTGLTGGPITTSGTVSIATGGVGNTQLASTSVDVTKLDTASTDARYFKQGGNALGATAILGTSDNNALDLRVNGQRVMRYEPVANSPNILGGSTNNSVGAFFGQTIAGGGLIGTDCYDPPTDSLTRSCGNRANSDFATIGGGFANVASASEGTVAGGVSNSASAGLAAVGGGHSNTASGAWATVAGGYRNTAGAQRATIGGGALNIASGSQSTIAGGESNAATGNYSTVAGGRGNTASGNGSWAGGRRAMAQTDDPTPIVHSGAFVWADWNDFDFNSAAINEFAVRATGGARFVTAIDGGTGAPTRTVAISPNGELSFGLVTRQMLNLYGGTWAIGVQPSTMYFRTGNHFGWYLNGAHVDNPVDPGPGGSMLMTLTNGASASTVVGTLRAQVVTATSDRAQKTAFDPVDAGMVLAKVAALPITSWEYGNTPGVRHLGPTGQDFRAAFGLGYDETSIATVDADGVALAAIQGLNAKVDNALHRKDDELARLRAELAELRATLAEALAGGTRVAQAHRPRPNADGEAFP